MIKDTNERRGFAIGILILIILATSSFTGLMPSLLQIQRANATATPLTTMNEPLLPSTIALSRSFTYPILQFQGQTVANLTETITWNMDGSTVISDSRGYKYSISLPVQTGTTFALLHNSTIVDQKVDANGVQYDIYWKPVENSNGYVDRYKFSIVGTSVNGSTIALQISADQNLYQLDNRILVTKPSFGSGVHNIDPKTLDPEKNWTSTLTGVTQAAQNGTVADPLSSSMPGIGLDWSDAAAAGYKVEFNSSNSMIKIGVGTSFNIDPTTVAQTNFAQAPDKSIDYDGEKRIIYDIASGTIFAFYYDGSNIVYKYSADGGSTWSSAVTVGTGTGVLTSDNYRWSIATTVLSGTRYISVQYWFLSGTLHYFYTMRGTVSGSSISWTSPIQLGYTAASNCSTGGSCAAVTTATDTNGNIFAAFRWISGGASTYSYNILESSDGGLTWSSSSGQVDGISQYRIDMALAPLSSGKMLFVYTAYDMSEFYYRVYTPGSGWSTATSTSGSGMSANTYKQLSGASDSTQSPYVAYVIGGNSGTLEVARWTNTGTFSTFESTNSVVTSHQLPSIVITADGNVRILTISATDNKIYETLKKSGSWVGSTNTLGTTFTSPNQLTSGIGYGAALWIEGTAPYNIRFGQDPVYQAMSELHNIDSYGSFSSVYVLANDQNPPTLGSSNPQWWATSFYGELTGVHNTNIDSAVAAGYVYYKDNLGTHSQALLYEYDAIKGRLSLIFGNVPSTPTFGAAAQFISFDSTNNCYNWKTLIINGNSDTQCYSMFTKGYSRVDASSSELNQFSSNAEFTSNQYLPSITQQFAAWSSASRSFGLYSHCDTIPNGSNFAYAVSSSNNGDTVDVTPPGTPSNACVNNILEGFVWDMTKTG